MNRVVFGLVALLGMDYVHKVPDVREFLNPSGKLEQLIVQEEDFGGDITVEHVRSVASKNGEQTRHLSITDKAYSIVQQGADRYCVVISEFEDGAVDLDHQLAICGDVSGDDITLAGFFQKTGEEVKSYFVDDALAEGLTELYVYVVNVFRYLYTADSLEEGMKEKLREVLQEPQDFLFYRLPDLTVESTHFPSN